MSESQYPDNHSSNNSIKALFFNKEDELRSGWRIGIFLFVFIIAAQLIGGSVILLGILVPAFRGLLQVSDSTTGSSWEEVLRFGVVNLVSLLSVFIANAVSARWLERRTFASTGFQFHKGWFKDWILGLLLGATTLTVAVGIAAAAGATTFTLKNFVASDLAKFFIFLAIFFIIGAAFEEALVRGFAFQALDHNLGAVVALSVTSLIFGVLHLQNPDVTVFSTLNTVLAGVWLGIAYLMTRSLWLATALHFSWNFVMAFVFGLPVSGIKVFRDFAWLNGTSTRSWISGAEYGPEGGVAVTLALLLCTLVIWKSGLFQTTSEMAQAIQHGKPADDSLSLMQQPNEPGLKD
jgi:uncharacterized protein